MSETKFNGLKNLDEELFLNMSIKYFSMITCKIFDIEDYEEFENMIKERPNGKEDLKKLISLSPEELENIFLNKV